MPVIELTQRERRWVDALVVLATIALGFVVLGYLFNLVAGLSDVILVFFLAWLIAFILNPLVEAVEHVLPLPRVAAVVVVYVILIAGLVAAAVWLAGTLSGSISDFVRNVPDLRTHLPDILAPWQARLDAIGLRQVNLLAQANTLLDNLSSGAGQLVEPLRQIAVASIGILGNLLLVFILSLYIVADREGILRFLFRITPPAFAEEARLLESSVARSFGGFLRGQAIMGILYAAIALISGAVFGLSYLPLTTVLVGLLQMIPFFGPFLSWSPPVLVAILTDPGAVLPTAIIMGIGWMVIMNVVQPRLMADAVGIHPIVVLGSVLVGAKVAGIIGAIFSIPVAAVLSAFFFHYLGRVHSTGPVAARAAHRLGEREGRPVRVPREPTPGLDPDVPDSDAVDTSPAGPQPVPPIQH